MVSTRSRSNSKEPSNVVESVEEIITPSKSSKRQQPRKSRSSKEGLKSKNTGIGLAIDLSSDSAKKNKKIVFDDKDDDDKVLDEAAGNEIVEQVEQNNNNGDQKKQKQLPAGNDNDGDDDDDDAVEEVKGAIAREVILQQLEAEVKGATKSKKKKKKRKEKKAEKAQDDDDNDDDDDNLDDKFFAKLETIKAEEQEKKEQESKKAAKGKHTTFVFQEKTKKPSTPKSVGHNIQVVVLGDQQETIVSNDPFTAIPTSSLTKEALVLSRSELKDGTDQGAKRKRNAPNLPDTSWKRSRKMNILATAKARFNRHGGRARPAANFATKSKS